jgi:N-acetylglucosaminyldiphosphoundecaprenol N-acetyl-beta-D-mannosaminyltransferase
MNAEKCQFFDFELTNGYPEDIVSDALASEAPSFHNALIASDVLVADGIGVVWAATLRGAKGLRKIAGFDLFSAAMAIANGRHLTVGFLGSTPEVLQMIVEKAAVDYPNCELRTLSPPFADHFTDQQAIDLVNKVGPVDVLCIGMTAPKQEKFAYQIIKYVDARAVMSIGAVFDFYAGTVNRPHPLLIKLGLEWLGRSIAEPRRLGKRSLVAIPTFIFNCLKLSVRNRRH